MDILSTQLAPRSTTLPSERFLIATCSGPKTLTLAKMLYEDHEVNCWVPKLKRKNPTKRQKHTVAAIPGFIFVQEDQWKSANEAQTNNAVPKFTPLVINDKHVHATLQELEILNKYTTSFSIDAEELGAMRPGDYATVMFGPLHGLHGTIEEIYIDMIAMVSLRIRANQLINLPVGLIRVR